MSFTTVGFRRTMEKGTQVITESVKKSNVLQHLRNLFFSVVFFLTLAVQILHKVHKIGIFLISMGMVSCMIYLYIQSQTTFQYVLSVFNNLTLVRGPRD